MIPENQGETNRGAEILKKAKYQPGSGVENRRGSNRWGGIALGIAIGAVAISPLAFVAGSRSNMHFVSDAELQAIANRPNEIIITAKCTDKFTSTPPPQNQSQQVLITFDRTNYQPVDGGVVLVAQTGDGPTFFRHMPANLIEKNPYPNTFGVDELRQMKGVSLSLYHEKNFIALNDHEAIDKFNPQTDLLERIAYEIIPADYCGTP